MEKAYREHGDVLAEHQHPSFDLPPNEAKSDGQVWTSD
jgi:hypothetical protein